MYIDPVEKYETSVIGLISKKPIAIVVDPLYEQKDLIIARRQ